MFSTSLQTLTPHSLYQYSTSLSFPIPHQLPLHITFSYFSISSCSHSIIPRLNIESIMLFSKHFFGRLYAHLSLFRKTIASHVIYSHRAICTADKCFLHELHLLNYWIYYYIQLLYVSTLYKLFFHFTVRSMILKHVWTHTLSWLQFL